MDFDQSLCRLYNPLLGGERRLNMLLLSNTVWIIIVVAVVVLVVVIGKKIKDRYY
jgi:amino acid permease